MDEKKKKVSVIVYDRLADKVANTARLLRKTPNELVNQCVEDCLRQIEQQSTPPYPLPIVKLARLVLMRDLSRGDRMLQDFLARHIDGWAEYQEDWRRFVLEEANQIDGELTPAVLAKVKKIADHRAKAVELERKHLNKLRADAISATERR